MAKPRHRRPSMAKKNIQRAATVTTGGMAVIAIGATSTPALASDTSEWDAIALCESGNKNIESASPISSASGYFQIIDGTWIGAGGLEFAPRAIDATYEQQMIVAQRIADRRGSLADWNASKGCWGDKIASTVPAPVATVQSTPVETPAPAPAPVAPAVTGDSVVNIARTYIGADYVWGGESFAEGGFDCSGLVFRVFSDLGISVPRTSSALAGVGTAVNSLDEALPGDILAWPGHVAIYSGNGMMIEASTPGSQVHERAVWGNPTIRRVTAAVATPEPAPVAPVQTEVAPEAAETPAPVDPDAQTEEYTVVSGDSLSKIASTNETTWQDIYADNQEVIGSNPNLIYPGQVFFVGGLLLPAAPVTVEEEPVAEEEVVPAEPETATVGETVPIPEPQLVTAVIYNSAGPVSPEAQAAANAVFTNVTGASLISIGGTRASARDPKGHPSGHALDYMVLSDAALGDAIVQYNIDNWDALGVEYIIWQQRILTSAGGTWKLMEDRGSVTENHYDHVHVNYN